MQSTRIRAGRYTIRHGDAEWEVRRLPGANRTARWRGTTVRDGIVFALEATSFAAVLKLVESGAHARRLGKADPQ